MRRWLSLLLVLFLVLGQAAGVSAKVIDSEHEEGAYWKEVPDYTERPTRPYPSYTYYSELPAILRDIDTRSNRVKVEVMGHSALGRDMFLVTVSDPTALGRLGHYQAFRHTMLKDPDKAQAMLEKGDDFKVPIFINASIHGGETPGVDAALRMLRRLAFDDDEEVRKILDNTIVLINIVQNPDGRIIDTRPNGNGFDCNRDFITLSQPESRATAAAIVKWKPMIFLDLHGFVNPMLIEPCTVPHNPNYEYDLYIKWALEQAEAMRTSVEANTPFQAEIPYLDYGEGWDDYPPIFTPMYAMYHGSIGHTLETPKKTEDGVNAHYYAIMAAARFAAENKVAMFNDQIEVFRRGIERVVQPDMQFPYAYVIPADPANQKDPVQAARAVEHLLFNGIEVQQAKKSFVAGGRQYPAGTFVVPMNQPLRALANTMLWDGEDISYEVSDMYDISAWNLPELWGFDAAAVAAPFDASLVGLSKPDYPAGAVDGDGPVYVLENRTNNAVKAVNELLKRGFLVQITTAPVPAGGEATLPAGTFVIPADQSGLRKELVSLANRYSIAFKGSPGPAPGLKTLTTPKVAVLGDAAVTFVLRNLGFNVTTIAPSDPLGAYDVLVASSAAPAAAVRSFVQSGKGYVGIGRYGLTGDLGTMLPVTYAYGNAYDNGVVRARYGPEGVVAAYYGLDDYAFVYRPLWFTGVGPGVAVDSWYGNGQFFVAGFWPNREPAAGKPAVVSGSFGQGKVVYVGFQPAFRAHTEYTFRLLSNSIFHCLK
ncbi:MAG: hypothetical protein HPY55_06795 [Firmicutes bacterium]|nr:hypothetical protein [Bacillota bacterium]